MLELFHTALEAVRDRVLGLSTREVLIIASVALFCAAIAWLGIHVGKVVDTLSGLLGRTAALESRQDRLQSLVLAELDMSQPVTGWLESRQDRLQSLVHRNSAKLPSPDWRDSMIETEYCKTRNEISGPIIHDMQDQRNMRILPKAIRAKIARAIARDGIVITKQKIGCDEQTLSRAALEVPVNEDTAARIQKVVEKWE